MAGNGQASVVGRKPGRTIILCQPWMEFIDFCEKLGHGEIAKVKIQDGLPVLVEMVTQKIKLV